MTFKLSDQRATYIRGIRESILVLQVHIKQYASNASAGHILKDTYERSPGVFVSHYVSAYHHIETEWDCPESPFGLCAYDTYIDPAKDNCIFCHQPFERK